MLKQTINNFPTNLETYQQTGIPWGSIFQPLSKIKKSNTIESIDEILRCEKCFSFISPFNHIDINSNWSCKLCEYSNHSKIPEKSRYTFIGENKPVPKELAEKMVEFEIPQPKKTFSKSKILICLLIDLTLQIEEIEATQKTLIDLVQYLNGKRKIYVGLFTIDSRLGVYQLDSDVPFVKYISIPQNSTDSIPLFLEEISSYSKIFVEISKNNSNIISAIQSLSQNTSKNEFGFGSSVKYIVDSLIQKNRFIFTQFICFMGSVPNYGCGQIEEEEQMNPSTNYYQNIADIAGQNAMAFHLFPFRYVGLSSLKFLSNSTGGEIYLSDPLNQETIFNNLKNIVVQEKAVSCLFRIRTSPYFKVSKIFGKYCKDEKTENLSTGFEQCIDKCAYIQISFAYTFIPGIDEDENEDENQNGMIISNSLFEKKKTFHRYIRLYNQQVFFTEIPSKIFQKSNGENIIFLLTQKMIQMSLHNRLETARETLTQWLCSLVENYLLSNAENKRKEIEIEEELKEASEFIENPELHNLFWWIHGILKSAFFCVGSDIAPDHRIAYYSSLLSLPPQFLSRSFYPKMMILKNGTKFLLKNVRLSKNHLKACVQKFPKFILVLDRFWSLVVFNNFEEEIDFQKEMRELFSKWKKERKKCFFAEIRFYQELNWKIIERYLIEDENENGNSFEFFKEEIKKKIRNKFK
ncbi:hypothetical protein M0811_04725 [Anaeramoeba ignava]|uniref:Protein transport protein SEC23 n=1 Tax=Anaeramoeba ignava TaxID=1746090 RepID=A0A9Q0RGA2_ANAIG|nr:hypothetical protein M0811_04725 [Anaeramoeba ignava]